MHSIIKDNDFFFFWVIGFLLILRVGLHKKLIDLMVH
jgi:hypothetical protein